MSSVNKVIIVGRLGQDPDVRQFANGGSVTNISVATSERWMDKNTGEQKEKTEWHRIVLQNRGNYRLGDIAAQYLRKGSLVYIEGSLSTRKYTDQQGVERSITEIRADSMNILSNNNQNNHQNNQQNSHSNQDSWNTQQSGAPAQQSYPQNYSQGYGQPQGHSQYPNHNATQGMNHNAHHTQNAQMGQHNPQMGQMEQNMGMGAQNMTGMPNTSHAPQGMSAMNGSPMSGNQFAQNAPQGMPRAQPKADGAPQPVDDDMPF